MANSDDGKCARLGFVSSARDNRKGNHLHFVPGARSGFGTLGGYYVNGMYYSREDVMVLANGEQHETLSIE